MFCVRPPAQSFFSFCVIFAALSLEILYLFLTLTHDGSYQSKRARKTFQFRLKTNHLWVKYFSALLKLSLDWSEGTMTANQAKDVVIRIPSYRSTVIPIREFKAKILMILGSNPWFSQLFYKLTKLINPLWNRWLCPYHAKVLLKLKNFGKIAEKSLF